MENIKIDNLTPLTYNELTSIYGGGSGWEFLGKLVGTCKNIIEAVSEAAKAGAENGGFAVGKIGTKV